MSPAHVEPLVLPTQEGYDRWAEVYDDDGNPLIALEEPEVDQLLGDIGGLDVVDVGCGDGFHLPHFAEEARSVVGVEPHPPLVERARRRGYEVLRGGAEALPLPDACADVVHARTAYFFGEGCEPGLAEADRVLRPGGVLAIVDLDFTVPPYGDWLRADLPRYDPAAVERFFARQGFTQERVTSTWRFPDRETLEDVLRIEFAPAPATRAIAETTGLSVPVGYRLHTRRRPAGIITAP